MLNVLMTPSVSQVTDEQPSGIQAVVKHYGRVLRAHDINFVHPNDDVSIDLMAIHAGTNTNFLPGVPVVAFCHGLYWSADYKAENWALAANRDVVDVLNHAEVITVPSAWVAKNIQRDMRRTPIIIPHGVNADEWAGNHAHDGYVLWNKNRPTDACSPDAVNILAKKLPKVKFLSTFAAPGPTPNVRVTGAVSHSVMRRMVMGAEVYLATAKETFGIGTLEAMAAGVPVLGWRYGGTAEIVEHGVTGFLAEPGDYDGLVIGYEYCVKHRAQLGANGRHIAKQYTWERAGKMVRAAFDLALAKASNQGVAVVIPCYNKASTLLRAVTSVLRQTRKPDEIIVVNNNSTDDFAAAYARCAEAARLHDVPISVTNCERQGVAYARNLGCYIAKHELNLRFVVCLDADDEIKPEFLQVCLDAMLQDASLGVAYTRLEAVYPNGQERISEWPSEYDYDQFLEGKNQVPTCAMFRLDDWEAAGGYKQRYAPMGAGSEDADFWLRLGAMGRKGKLVSQEALFRYHLGGLVSGNPNYREVNWRGNKPWVQDKKHPFASVAKPRNGLSHLVTQYDQPYISVVIPCAEHHLPLLETALDSLEAQTFRKWETVVVLDGVSAHEGHKYLAGYPHANVLYTDHIAPRGAGAARNLGASNAKGTLLLFLDADDWLEPTALQVLAEAYAQSPGSVIYSDYYGHAYIENKDELGRMKINDRLVAHDEKTGLTVMRYYAAAYDCERAQRQPEGNKGPYIWNVVTSLVPAAYHRNIGGFDETMESWEDWDYWLRMARRGVCFEHVAQPLFNYRFHTGTRRQLANPGESGDSGRQLSSKLLEYIARKFRGIATMPCKSCGGKRTVPPPMPEYVPQSLNEGMLMNISSDDMVMVELNDGNIGDHLISFSGTSYGYRRHGEQFMMQRSHAAVDRRVRVVQDAPVETFATSVTMVPEPPPAFAPAFVEPPSVSDDVKNEAPLDVESTEKQIVLTPVVFDFLPIWGINAERQKVILEAGIRSLDGFLALGTTGIERLLNVPNSVAKRILSSAESMR